MHGAHIQLPGFHGQRQSEIFQMVTQVRHLYDVTKQCARIMAKIERQLLQNRLFGQKDRQIRRWDSALEFGRSIQLLQREKLELREKRANETIVESLLVVASGPARKRRKAQLIVCHNHT